MADGKITEASVQSLVWRLTTERNTYRKVLMTILKDWKKIKSPSTTDKHWIDRIERVLGMGNS